MLCSYSWGAGATEHLIENEHCSGYLTTPDRLSTLIITGRSFGRFPALGMGNGGTRRDLATSSGGVAGIDEMEAGPGWQFRPGVSTSFNTLAGALTSSFEPGADLQLRDC